MTFYRLLNSAPSVKNTIWSLTKFVLDNIQAILIPSSGSFREMESCCKDNCKSLYEYEDPVLKPFNHIENRTSIVDLMLDEE